MLKCCSVSYRLTKNVHSFLTIFGIRFPFMENITFVEDSKTHYETINKTTKKTSCDDYFKELYKLGTLRFLLFYSYGHAHKFNSLKQSQGVAKRSSIMHLDR